MSEILEDFGINKYMKLLFGHSQENEMILRFYAFEGSIIQFPFLLVCLGWHFVKNSALENDKIYAFEGSITQFPFLLVCLGWHFVKNFALENDKIYAFEGSITQFPFLLVSFDWLSMKDFSWTHFMLPGTFYSFKCGST